MFGRSYPSTRMRRMRADSFSRALVRESTVAATDLIYPVFAHDSKASQPVASLPGVMRYSVDDLLRVCEEAVTLGIPAIAVFPVIDGGKKTDDAREAYNSDGFVPKIVARVKKALPSLGVITDIALDPYTSHGQDGLIDSEGRILNDETITVLRQQALCHAAAGVDIVAPSDMMDGRIGEIRRALDGSGYKGTRILAYSAKYASSFYGPFRDAVGSAANLGKADKFSYQMDPANYDEAVHEVALDIQEGADMVMVKPGTLYLDVIRLVRDTFRMPTFAYHVSGEYAMLKAAAAQGSINEKACVMETMTCFKRAGATAILTYFAKDVAQWLRQSSG